MWRFRRSWRVAVGSLLALLGLQPRVWADEFHGSRTGTLSERRHTAVLTLSSERAELVVERTVYNPAAISDEARFLIELPPGAVATRLRSRGTGPQGPWFEGELMEAEQAAAKYQELTGIGGYYPKDPALLSWRYQGMLALQVFPCPARAEKVVEYTLQLPLGYEKGGYHVKLPALGTEALPASIRVVAPNAHDTLSVDGKAFESGGDLPAPPVGESLDIALGHAAAPLEVELSSQSFARGRVLTHYAVRAAPQLSQAPKQAYVVIVIDASRSMGESFEPSAKNALDAYLSQMPDAHVEVLTFDRQVRAQLGEFRDVSAARQAIQRLSLGRRNGSEVDRALFEADQLLTTAPSSAPRRIVLLTDSLTRQALTPERLRGAIGQSHAVLHVGLLGAASAALSRVDDHAWSSVVRRTGGVVWDASAPDDDSLDADTLAELRATYEEWVRPLRIDNISAFSGDTSLSEKVPTTLDEGEGSQELYLESQLARSLSVNGELWSTPIQVMARQDTAKDARWASLVFGSDLLDSLSEPEQMTLALRGRAVSPVTSYLAIEPGVRPSTEGLEESTGMGFGMASVSSSISSNCRFGSPVPALDREAYLRTALAAELVRCGGQAGSAYANIETTRDEIVEVEASGNQTPLAAAVASCFHEAAWSLLLPAGFDEAYARFRVEL
jgi:hypothetical protein